MFCRGEKFPRATTFAVGCPAYALSVDRVASHYQVGIGENRRLAYVTWDNSDVEDGLDPGSDGIGNRMSVAAHGLVGNRSLHWWPSLILARLHLRVTGRRR